jgi:hypothetical protein
MTLLLTFWCSVDLHLLTDDSVWIKMYLPRLIYVITIAAFVFSSDHLINMLPACLIIGGQEAPIIVLLHGACLYLFTKI